MTTVVALVVAVVVVAAWLVALWMERRRAAARNSPPPLFFALPPQSVLKASNGNGTANGATHSNGTAHANGALSTNGPARALTTPPYAKKVGLDAPTPIPRAAAARPRTQPQRTAASPGDDYRDGETVRFYRPSEEALQLLPGHLEVLEGATREREIRFVRVPGEPPHVLLGRDAGPSPSMVGLGSTTVSRRHARLDYVDGRWHVMNLSRTNPLVVNDDQLADTDAARVLADGDRLELGEVVLRFHEH